MKKEDGCWTAVEYTKERFDKELPFARVGHKVTISDTSRELPLRGVINKMEAFQNGNVKIWICELHDEKEA